MHSRQDYVIAVEKRRDTDSEGDDPGDAARRRVLRSYVERCVESATRWYHIWNFAEL